MKKVKNLFIKDYKKVMLLVILVILFCGSFLYTTNSKAVTDLGNYISVKLDTNDLFNDQLWEFQSVPGNHNFFDVTTTSYTPGATTYDCALFLVEEWGGVNPDKPYIVWTENEVVLTAVDGNSLSSDIGGNYVNCCVVTGLGGPCASSSCLGWNVGPAGPLDVFLRAYSTGWTDKCSGSDCALSSSDTHYRPDTEILCETTWKQCGAAETSCNSYGGRAYACNSGFWDRCTGTTPICSAGACVAASGLSLAVSASATTISTSGTSNITFTVKNGATLISGATVGTISVVGGKVDGSATTTCTTGASGTCIVVYTAPTAVGLYTINAQKATKTGFTASGSVSIGITVNDCVSPIEVKFVGATYNVGDSINFSAKYTNGVDYTRCLYKGSSDVYDDFKTGTGGWQSSSSVATASVGTWVVTLEPGAVSCPSFASASSCRASTIVATATCTPDGGACSVGDCCNSNCNGGTCCTTNVTCATSACAEINPTSAEVTTTCTDANGCVGATSSTADCCLNNGHCAGGTPVCNPATEQCVQCITSDDCAGTDVCNSGTCIPCSDEGVDPGDADLCCFGLSYLDLDDDETFVCTSACDPNAWFFCNPLRGSVETIVEAGETLLGYILGLIGSVALLFIIVAGVMYMTSAGNEERISSSKRILSGAVIGLMIALLAYGLLHVIMTVLGM